MTAEGRRIVAVDVYDGRRLPIGFRAYAGGWGFVVTPLEVTGNLRVAVTGPFIAGQSGVPGVVWIGEGMGMEFLSPTVFLWGGSLIDAMLNVVYETVTGPSELAERGARDAETTDD